MHTCFAENEIGLVGEWPGRGVAGHPGLVARWICGDRPVVLALGRRHLYEGYSAEEVAELVIEAASAGVRRLLVTNAAGGLNPLLRTGDLVLHSGYLGVMLGRRGMLRHEAGIVNERPAGGTGQPTADGLRSLILDRGLKRGIAFRQGVYAGVLGPDYETRAEIRMLRRMGADLVGMSTVVEVTAATRRGMTVAGFSLVTNVSSDVHCAPLCHDEVTEASATSAARLRAALEVCVETLAGTSSIDL